MVKKIAVAKIKQKLEPSVYDIRISNSWLEEEVIHPFKSGSNSTRSNNKKKNGMKGGSVLHSIEWEKHQFLRLEKNHELKLFALELKEACNT